MAVAGDGLLGRVAHAHSGRRSQAVYGSRWSRRRHRLESSPGCSGGEQPVAPEGAQRDPDQARVEDPQSPSARPRHRGQPCQRLLAQHGRIGEGSESGCVRWPRFWYGGTTGAAAQVSKVAADPKVGSFVMVATNSLAGTSCGECAYWPMHSTSLPCAENGGLGLQTAAAHAPQPP